jgi:hypothetical protein
MEALACDSFPKGVGRVRRRSGRRPGSPFISSGFALRGFSCDPSRTSAQALRAARPTARREGPLESRLPFTPARVAPWPRHRASGPPPRGPAPRSPAEKRRRAPPSDAPSESWLKVHPKALRLGSAAPLGSFSPPFLRRGSRTARRAVKATPSGSACGRALTAPTPPEPVPPRKAGTKDLSPERSRESKNDHHRDQAPARGPEEPILQRRAPRLCPRQRPLGARSGWQGAQPPAGLHGLRRHRPGLPSVLRQSPFRTPGGRRRPWPSGHQVRGPEVGGLPLRDLLP